MAVPVINPQSSVPTPRVNQPFSFSLALATTSEAATSWAALDPLPPGLAINTTTGVITGTPTNGGIHSVRITATNGTGTSTPVTVAFGVIPVPYTAQGVPEINLSLDTFRVWNPGIDEAAAPLFGKSGDTSVIALGLMKSGFLQDKTISQINVRLRDEDDSEPFPISTGSFQKVGAGDNTRYYLALNWGHQMITQLMQDTDNASSVGRFVYAEIEIIFFELLPGGSTPSSQPVSSRTFVCHIQKDF